MPRPRNRRDEESELPQAITELFPDDIADDKLTMITETPPHLIMRMVQLEVVAAALDPKRKVPLSKIWKQAFDRRMISKGREGRKEFIDIFHQNREKESLDTMEF